MRGYIIRNNEIKTLEKHKSKTTNELLEQILNELKSINKTLREKEYTPQKQK